MWKSLHAAEYGDDARCLENDGKLLGEANGSRCPAMK
jgi:hypothetical protein